MQEELKDQTIVILEQELVSANQLSDKPDVKLENRVRQLLSEIGAQQDFISDLESK